MALNIEHPEVERLAAEVAALTGESKAEAIRQALLERPGHAPNKAERAEFLGTGL